MRVSDNGIALIKKYEGCRLKAYKALPSEKYYTIGYGHYGADVTADMEISASYAVALLRLDLDKFCAQVNALGRTWTQNQYDALVSFAYNCGAANLKRLVGNRKNREIADAMLLYVNANGKPLEGLKRRRKEERELFLKG